MIVLVKKKGIKLFLPTLLFPLRRDLFRMEACQIFPYFEIKLENSMNYCIETLKNLLRILTKGLLLFLQTNRKAMFNRDIHLKTKKTSRTPMTHWIMHKNQSKQQHLHRHWAHSESRLLHQPKGWHRAKIRVISHGILNIFSPCNSNNSSPQVQKKAPSLQEAFLLLNQTEPKSLIVS